MEAAGKFSLTTQSYSLEADSVLSGRTYTLSAQTDDILPGQAHGTFCDWPGLFNSGQTSNRSGQTAVNFFVQTDNTLSAQTEGGVSFQTDSFACAQADDMASVQTDQLRGRQTGNIPELVWEELELEEADESLRHLAAEALESGSLGPLIKEELRCSIQARRLAQGQAELQVNFSTPSSHQLRPEEEERLDRRRHQNREAARRFRHKQKERAQLLAEENERLEAENAGLRRKIQQLTSEKTQLTNRLLEHARTCHLQRHRLPPHLASSSRPSLAHPKLPSQEE